MNSKKEEYKSFLQNGLENIKPLILECLLEYYGYQYAREIISRFNNINYFFYLNEKKYEKQICARKKTLSSNYLELNKDYKLVKREIIKYSRWCEKEKILKNRYIYSTADIDYFNNEFLEFINDNYINKNLNCMHSALIDNEYLRLVYSPVFFSSDECLIHEIVHAIMAIPLFYTVDESGNEQGYDKCGFIVNNKNGKYLEESITEIEARNIYKLFKEKGGNFLDKIYYSKTFDCAYHLLDPIVMPFYNKYKEEIIDSRITLNKNKILYLCGKENFESYANAVNECYKEYPKKSDMIDYLYLCNSHLKKIDEHAKEKRLELTL